MYVSAISVPYAFYLLEQRHLIDAIDGG